MDDYRILGVLVLAFPGLGRLADFDLGEKCFSSPIVAGDRVLIGARDDRLHALDILC